MDEVIKIYLESCEPFNRLFGEEGMVELNHSAISPKLLDFSLRHEKGMGRPLDADDLREIGAVLILLSDKLKERNK